MGGKQCPVRRAIGDDKGFTLFEVLVVMAIMGILMTLAIISFSDMRQRQLLERQTKGIYADIQSGRLRAIQRGVDEFVSLQNPAACRIFEDTGDTFFSAATDSLVSDYSLVPPYTMVLSNAAVTLVQFSPKGMVSEITPTVSIRVVPSVEGTYDCVTIEVAKTVLGKWDDTTKTCIIK